MYIGKEGRFLLWLCPHWPPRKRFGLAYENEQAPRNRSWSFDKEDTKQHWKRQRPASDMSLNQLKTHTFGKFELLFLTLWFQSCSSWIS